MVKQKITRFILAVMLAISFTFSATAFADNVTGEKIITVKNVKELMATENSTKKGHVTVLIEDGTYELSKGLWLTGNNITYRSRSGNREKVILKGNFKVSHIFWITNDNVTIRDISIGEVNNHGIQIHSEMDADNAKILNVHFFNIKEQMLKGSGSKNKSFSNDCVVENCLFEFTEGSAYQYYTGGIDVHKGKNWIVRNNTFKNICFPKGNLTEGAVHFWDESSGTKIIKNTIINCDRGIMLGLDSSPHDQGTIQSNNIEVNRDVGIYLCNATNSSVVENTVLINSSYPNAIEYRFKTTGSIIKENKTNRSIKSRNGGTAKVTNNTISDSTQVTQTGIATKRKYPDSSDKIVYFADQITVKKTPSSFTKEQLKFVAEKFAGTQKITKGFGDAIRAYNPQFLVLHYRLGIWQSAVPYITDGEHWNNDYDLVNTEEAWFSHAESDSKQRVVSDDDGKLLLNIANPDLMNYFKKSLLSQVRLGDDDGAFLDSSSPASLQYYLGKKYTEYAGTNVKNGYIKKYEVFMEAISKAMEESNYITFPNIGAQITSWDNTDYSKCTGAFSEGCLDWERNYGLSDYKLGMNNLLKLIHQDKYVICQTYLKRQEEYNWRMNIICNYLLIKGKHTYISYFADKPFEYYPEFDLNLGKALKSANDSIDDLKVNDLYVREFSKGVVIVNPDKNNSYLYKIPKDKTVYLVELIGGGDINADGTIEGRIKLKRVTSNMIFEPVSSAILIYE